MYSFYSNKTKQKNNQELVGFILIQALNILASYFCY